MVPNIESTTFQNRELKNDIVAPLTHKVRVKPMHCDAVELTFSVPQGFESIERKYLGSTELGWRTSGDPSDLQFLNLDAYCADTGPRGLDARVRNARSVHVTDQKEYPFADSQDPATRALRLKVTVLKDESKEGMHTLELRNTYPDGHPPGFLNWTFRVGSQQSPG